MRVGDIYFRQMDKPDRDYTKTVHAEEEYRLMLQQFPDSPLVPQARQRLREVQETLASREASIGQFYAEREPPDLPGAVARYQTVVDTYPLYSKIDEVLIGLGDLYAAQAKFIRSLRLPEAGKARLEKIYDDQAADAYRKVILEHSAAPHVEDARDRLVGMGLPIPTPTPEQVAASTALENSRGQYTLSKRATLLFLHQADTVPAATVGTPLLEDPKKTLAPTIVRKAVTDFNSAMSSETNSPPAAGSPASAAAPAENAQPAAAQVPTPASNAPLSLQDVPTAGSGSSNASTMTNVPQGASTTPAGGTSMGIEIVQPSGSTPAPGTGTTTFPGSTAAPAAATPSEREMGGIKPVTPNTPAPLPAVEKPAAAPDAVNEVTPGSQPAAQAPPANGKKAKPVYDKSDASSSKKKKKKGLDKLNPF